MLNEEEIRKYATDLSNQIDQLTSFKSTLDKLLLGVQSLAEDRYLELIHGQKEIKDRQDYLEKHLMLRGMPGINNYEYKRQKIAELLSSEDWPEAVPKDCIAVTDEELDQRANGILDIFIIEDLTGIRFLDVGCGEGHVVNAASKREVSKAVGFDIKKEWKFEDSDVACYSNNLTRIKKNAPYDIIMAYDVIDHVEEITPLEMLHEMKNLLSPNGKIYLRAHPWCSRHGGHLYKKVNKAYLHLIFDELEISRTFGLEMNEGPILKITHPQETYRDWFENAGLSIKDESIVSKDIEDIFKKEHVLRESLENSGISLDNLCIEYVDYILEAKDLNQKVF